MKQKRIMILGGNFVQAEATKAAKRLGYYAISTDLHEDNPGHKIADLYCKVDITDREAVLREAQRLEIDGIIPFCSDILAPVAAYVQDKMGLPGNPYDVIYTMTHKHLFRELMRKNGFCAPRSVAVSNLEDAIKAYSNFNKAIMKPTDSAGSKGVFKIDNVSELSEHWEETVNNSPSHTVIIEDFISSVGLQQDGDIFVVDGKIVFWGMCDQYKDSQNEFMIAAESFPSTQDASIQNKARSVVQDIITQIGFLQGPCNVEYLVDENQQIWVLEIGPRNGGLLIPFLIEKSTEIDLTELTVRQAVGESVAVPEGKHVCYAMSTVHRKGDGTVDLNMITGNTPLKPW